MHASQEPTRAKKPTESTDKSSTNTKTSDGDWFDENPAIELVRHSQGSMRTARPIRRFHWETAFDVDLVEVNAASAEWLPTLRKEYTLKDKDSDYEQALSETPKLYPLLSEAIAPLHAAFPANTIFRLEAVRDDDAMLRVVVKVPAEHGGAAEMMKRFKQNWWYRNSHRSNAALVFDYETPSERARIPVKTQSAKTQSALV